MRVFVRFAVAAIAAALVWWWWSGGEEARIRARLHEAAEAVGALARESGLGRVAGAAGFARLLDRDIRVTAPDGRSIEGGDAVIGFLTRAAGVEPFTVQLADLEVRLEADERRAAATATALVEGSGRLAEETAGQELRFELTRVDDEWLIAAVDAVAAIERP
ncbi:MAG TPA: nuclear transport factor 2 family protein [Vicinamibacterales bacterium]